MARAQKLLGVMAMLPIAAGIGAVTAPHTSVLASVPAPPASTSRPLLGRQVTLGKVVHESLATITARDRQAGPPSPRVVPAPGKVPDRGNVPTDPASSNLTSTPDPHVASGTASPSVAQTLGTQFLGAQLSDALDTPPDSMGAVGPTQYIVIVNGRIRSFAKSTGIADGVLNISTDSFFASVRGANFTSDPHVRYDRLTGRWFFTMISVAHPNRVLISFTDTGVIAYPASFHFTYYDVSIFHTTCLWDYDTLGIDQNALYIGGNLFCPSYHQSDGLVVPKADLLAGSPGGTDFLLDNSATVGCSGDGPIFPEGVDNYDSTSTLGYFAGTLRCTRSELGFVRITDPAGTPSGALVKLTVPEMYPPAPSPAMGSLNPLDAGTERLSPTLLRNGHLWTAQGLCVDTTGAVTPGGSCPTGNRDAIRWYDVTNLATTPVVNQSGTIFDPAPSDPRFYSFPSIMVSGQGHVAMGASVDGNTEHAEAATMGRLAGDAQGTMQAAVVYQTSTFTYNLGSGDTNPHRWGDYSYTSLDPTDDMTMWTIQEFANATDSWGVEVVKLLAPPPATPTSVAGGPFVANQSCLTLNVTGTSSNGSGFFDPGAGFANHITASVSGGVTVNHVTYIDPTHITLDISTQGAAPGLKDLTVTNPDGQAVTASGFLNIEAATTNPGMMSASTTNQYSLSNSDGATWVEIDPVRLRLTCTPAANQSALLTANTDLWTGSAGFNQDIGIFVSDNGAADTLLAWKESGGNGGTSSPNAAYAQYLFPMLSGHAYVFKLKWKTNSNDPGGFIAAGAGVPGNHSPISLIAEIFPTATPPNFATSSPTDQYSLTSSDGTTWTPMDDPKLSTTLSPVANSTAVLGANSDLWTGSAGFNQDIGIFVSVDGAAEQFDTIVAWKESGGSAGTSSPNAAFVKATWPMNGGHSYTFRLKWKAGRNDPGGFIAAGAGTSGNFSPISLVAQTIALGLNPYHVEPNRQFSLSNSDGVTWQPVDIADTALDVTVSPGSNTNCILGANADLWTGTAGFNQDIGIFVSDNGGQDTLVAWKESGGAVATSSPNAAFAQATFAMTAGHAYVFKLKWKTSTTDPGGFIAAGAGVSGNFSPIRLTVELVN